MSETIHRFEIPVDGAWHEVAGAGYELLHVAGRTLGKVEFWAWARPQALVRRFRVYGTGEPVEGDVLYWGTTIDPRGYLVWHLVEAQ